MSVYRGNWNGRWEDWKHTYSGQCIFWTDHHDPSTNYAITRQGIVSAVPEKHLGLPETVLHESDFSSGTDGFVLQAGTYSTFDGIGGRDNVWGGYPNTVNQQHYLYKSLNPEIQLQLLRYTFDVYYPSSMPNLQDIYAFWGGARWGGDAKPYQGVPVGTDQWISGTLMHINDSYPNFLMYTYQGGTLSYAGSDDPADTFYFDNFKAVRLEGNHLRKGSNSQPNMTGSGYTSVLIYDGGTDALFADDTSDFEDSSIGMIAWVAGHLSTLPSTEFAMNDASADTDFIRFGTDYDTYAEHRVVIDISTGTRNLLFSSTAVSNGDVIQVMGDGASYRLFINNVEDTIDVSLGSNNGNWWNTLGVSASNISQGAIYTLTPTYFNQWSREVVVLDGQVSEKIRRAVYNKLSSWQ